MALLPEDPRTELDGELVTPTYLKCDGEKLADLYDALIPFLPKETK